MRPAGPGRFPRGQRTEVNPVPPAHAPDANGAGAPKSMAQEVPLVAGPAAALPIPAGPAHPQPEIHVSVPLLPAAPPAVIARAPEPAARRPFRAPDTVMGVWPTAARAPTVAPVPPPAATRPPMANVHEPLDESIGGSNILGGRVGVAAVGVFTESEETPPIPSASVVEGRIGEARIGCDIVLTGYASVLVSDLERKVAELTELLARATNARENHHQDARALAGRVEELAGELSLLERTHSGFVAERSRMFASLGRVIQIRDERLADQKLTIQGLERELAALRERLQALRLNSDPKYYLRIYSGEERGETYPISGNVLIGRKFTPFGMGFIADASEIVRNAVLELEAQGYGDLFEQAHALWVKRALSSCVHAISEDSAVISRLHALLELRSSGIDAELRAHALGLHPLSFEDGRHLVRSNPLFSNGVVLRDGDLLTLGDLNRVAR